MAEIVLMIMRDFYDFIYISHQWTVTCTKSSFLETFFCNCPHGDHKRESNHRRSEGNPSQDKKNTISSGAPSFCYRYQRDQGQNNADGRYSKSSKDQEMGENVKGNNDETYRIKHKSYRDRI